MLLNSLQSSYSHSELGIPTTPSSVSQPRTISRIYVNGGGGNGNNSDADNNSVRSQPNLTSRKVPNNNTKDDNET